MGDTLQGKVAIVTGAASGIGAAIARLYANHGCKVVVADTDETGGAAVAAEVGGLASIVDVAQEDQVRAMVGACEDAFGRLDILVNNAGIVPRWSRAEDTDLAVWDQVFAVNVRGVMACIKHALPLLGAHAGRHHQHVVGAVSAPRSQPTHLLGEQVRRRRAHPLDRGPGGAPRRPRQRDLPRRRGDRGG